MKGQEISVIGVGSPVIDFVVTIDRKSLSQIGGQKGGMELVDSNQIRFILGLTDGKPVKTPGGSAGNTTFALTRMGMNCSFLGKLGDDKNGRDYKALFHIKTSRVNGVDDG